MSGLSMVLLVVVLGSPFLVKSCGIVTHHEIAYRALETFDTDAFGGPGYVRGLMEKYKGSLEAASTFPDLFYNSLCSQDPQVSENLHWAPFFEVAFRYFRNTYTTEFEGNEDAERLLVFLLGMTSHHSADISWHGLEGLDNSIMDTVAELSFDGDFGTAHNYMDFGGDILGVTQWNTSFAIGWEIPSVDIYNILIEYNGGDDGGIGVVEIETCAAWLLAGRTAELAIGRLAYPYIRRQSVAFLDTFEDFYIGGVADMAAWTQLVWDNSLEWIQNYDSCTLGGQSIMTDVTCNQVLALADSRNISKEELEIFKAAKERYFVQLGELIKNSGVESKVKVEKRGSGAVISIENDHEHVHGSPYSKEDEHTHEGLLITHEREGFSEYEIFSSRASSNFGSALKLADLNGDGVDDLIIGAPSYYDEAAGSSRVQGCVFVVLGFTDANGQRLPSGDIEEVAAAKHCQSGGVTARLGHSLDVADINGDFIPDVIVGAPGAGSDTLDYEGMVVELLGSVNAGTGEYEFGEKIERRVEGLANGALGYAISAGDSEYLASAPHLSLDGARQAGGVLPSAEADVVLTGSDAFEWFGHSVTFIDAAARTVAVGSPAFTDCSQGTAPCLNSAGKVTIWDMNSTSQIGELRGSSPYQQYGYTLAVGTVKAAGIDREALVVSSPSYSSGGLAEIGLVSVFDATSLDPIASVEGEQEFGRFGFAVSVGAAGQLLVGCPRCGSAVGEENGGLYTFPDIMSTEFFEYLEGTNPMAHMGTSIASTDNHVVVSEPRAERGARASGSLIVRSFVVEI